MTSPSPSQLWRAAQDKHPRDPLAARDAYRCSMLELGYIEPGMPMTAPCEWSPATGWSPHPPPRDEPFGPPRSSQPSTRVPQPCQPEFDLIDHQPPVRMWPVMLLLVGVFAVWAAVVIFVL